VDLAADQRARERDEKKTEQEPTTRFSPVGTGLFAAFDPKGGIRAIRQRRRNPSNDRGSESLP
jgi:hypothetical protein